VALSYAAAAGAGGGGGALELGPLGLAGWGHPVLPLIVGWHLSDDLCVLVRITRTPGVEAPSMVVAISSSVGGGRPV
jgi:hypothetical protein